MGNLPIHLISSYYCWYCQEVQGIIMLVMVSWDKTETTEIFNVALLIFACRINSLVFQMQELCNKEILWFDSWCHSKPRVIYRFNHAQVSSCCLEKPTLISPSHQSWQNSSPNGCIQYQDTQESTTVVIGSETARKSFSFVRFIAKETAVPGKTSVRPKEKKCTEAK